MTSSKSTLLIVAISVLFLEPVQPTCTYDVEGFPIMIGLDSDDCYATNVNYGSSGASFISGICCSVADSSDCYAFMIFFDYSGTPMF
jgi:hypothetical protein